MCLAEKELKQETVESIFCKHIRTQVSAKIREFKHLEEREICVYYSLVLVFFIFCNCLVLSFPFPLLAFAFPIICLRSTLFLVYGLKSPCTLPLNTPFHLHVLCLIPSSRHFPLTSSFPPFFPPFPLKPHARQRRPCQIALLAIKLRLLIEKTTSSLGHVTHPLLRRHQ